MKLALTYSPAAIKKFSRTVLRPRVAIDFVPFYRDRDLVRQTSNFVQLIALSGGRYGETLKVLPTFYVVGARPFDEVITQSIALHVEHPNKWRFQGRHLDECLADDICVLLSDESFLSFFAPIGATDVVATLTDLAKNATSEDAPLFLAFFMMANEIQGADIWIERARKKFLQANPVILHDWQRATMQRLDEIQQRLGAPNAAILSREEAQDHAARLQLPRIEWRMT